MADARQGGMGQPRVPDFSATVGASVTENLFSFIHLTTRPSWQLKIFPVTKVYNESNINIYPLYEREYYIFGGKETLLQK